MKVSYNFVDSILQTLPIGYYLGTSCRVELDETGNETFCDLDKQTITVSFPMIAQLAKRLPNENPDALENDIRGLLYHEISHLILTGLGLMQIGKSEWPVPDSVCNELSNKGINVDLWTRQKWKPALRDIVNIFEDERIETILRHYYRDVNFYELIRKVNGDWNGCNVKTAREKFYAIVRFHVGTTEQLSAVSEAVAQLSKMTRDQYSLDAYAKQLRDLWTKLGLPENIVETFDNPQQIDLPQTVTHDNDCDPGKLPMSDATKDLIEQATQMFRENAKKTFESDKYAAASAAVNRIFKAALAKKATLAGASHGYSGAIDPRACGNRDYRWFNKQGGDGSDRFSKVHLNLVVDCSGSFYNSVGTVNAFIRALNEFEAREKNFSFDVLKLNETAQRCARDDRYIEADGGNDLPDELADLMKSMHKANTREYTLVVFDGDALSYGPNEHKHNARVFNNPNTYIISDTDNTKLFDAYAPLAKRKYITRDYASAFLAQVIETLEKAFA